MKAAHEYRIVLVTAPDQDTARTLAQAALKGKLAACVNLVPKLESHYWWQGKLESSTEVLMLIKTDQKRLEALEKLLLTHHPYDTPEILAVPLESGTPKYLEWISSNLQG